MQDKLGRDLAAQTGMLTDTISASCQKVLDGNARFSEQHLKGFEQRGQYAVATIQQAQQQLQQVEAAVTSIRYETSAIASFASECCCNHIADTAAAAADGGCCSKHQV